MKKLGNICFVLTICALFFTACEKQEPVLAELVEDENVEVIDVVVEDIDEDIAQSATARSAGNGPDLIIPILASNLPNTGNCAVPVGAPQLPNATCNGALGGSKSFFLGVRIRNIGNQAVAPGSFKVSWALSGFPLQAISIVNHPGIPPGGTVSVTRNWSLPCPTSTPIGLVTRTFTATVDVSNDVNECDENNNVSRPYRICDDA